ncbi:hypothetical protein C1H76_6551 [Elsinoe australis]|uniref:FHA domain-containing protein n=1 Tax=Elsinoe australis TaxID=40998 RepID=A0A4U7AW73_9PEZI|nr:hypothetical protein C1H76_6551 [Elsinoe australis]
MWFLSCDGDHLDGKSIWLRPGSKHLFGRTHPTEGTDQFHAITHKSVSRRHFELHVAEVEPGASAKIYKRSTITIKDLGSKVGTTIGNEKIRDKEHSFNTGDHVIRLGNYEMAFHIKWLPMVFSFTSLSRSARQAGDPLAEYRAKVEDLDVKCTTEYIANQTSHVITKKRNTAMALQALVNGRAIVTERYLDAIRKAGERPPADGDEVTVSSLEKDWDLNWPKEIDFLPEPSSEPNPRPEHDEIFLPKAPRAEMFNKYLFIFMTQVQHETFLPVITGGGGKVLLKEVGPPEEEPDFDDFLDFVKNCAGKKGVSAFRLSQYPAEKGGVVVVRPGDATRVGGVEFIQRLDLALDQRSVQQNEFLEAILTTDPTILRRPLEVEMVDADEEDRPETGRSTTHGPPASDDQRAPTPPVPPQSSAPIRKQRRNITRQRISTFDDFDPSQIQRYSPPPSQADDAVSQSRRSSVQVSDADSANGPSQAPTQNSRKRRAETQYPVETTGEVLDGLFAGSAAIKRRRQEEAQEGGKKRGHAAAASDDDDAAPTGKAPSQAKHKKRKTDKEIEEDLQAKLKEHTEEENRRRAADKEYLEKAMEGVDISKLKDLVKVEDMPVRSFTPALERCEEKESWNPDWNGRANWKRFKKRRPGEQAEEPGPNRRRVIVGLEPAEQNSGRMEVDWRINPSTRYSQSDTQSTRKENTMPNGMRRRRRTTTTDSDAGGDDDSTANVTETPEDAALRRAVEQSRLDDEREEEAAENDVLDMGNVRDPEMRKRQADARKRERERKAAGKNGAQTTTQTVSEGAGTQRQSLLSGLREMDRNGPRGAAGKEVVNANGSERVARKRARERDEDEDDEGGLKFRRRRRG